MRKTFYYSCVPIEEREQQANQFRSIGASEAEIYIDMATSKPCDRINLEVLKQTTLHRGDVLVVPMLDCLSDSEQGIHDELQWISNNGICLRVMDIPATMTDYPGQETKVAQLISLLLLQFYDVAVLQKKVYKQQRQTEGIHAARAKGVRFGRPPMEREPKFEELKKQWENGQISLREGGRQLGVTHKTFQKWVTEGKVQRESR